MTVLTQIILSDQTENIVANLTLLSVICANLRQSEQALLYILKERLICSEVHHRA